MGATNQEPKCIDAVHYRHVLCDQRFGTFIMKTVMFLYAY